MLPGDADLHDLNGAAVFAPDPDRIFVQVPRWSWCRRARQTEDVLQVDLSSCCLVRVLVTGAYHLSTTGTSPGILGRKRPCNIDLLDIRKGKQPGQNIRELLRQLFPGAFAQRRCQLAYFS